MAQNVSANATVTVGVNTQGAAQSLDMLRQRIDTVRNEIDRLKAAGTRESDPQLRALRREWQQLSREIGRCRTEAFEVNNVLQHLDSASVEQLNAALKKLRREMSQMQRGTAAWEDHAESIRLIEAELERVSRQVRQEGVDVRRVLQNLDQASPEVLNKTLRQLREELNGMRRGTGLWNQQVRRIRDVQLAIDGLNRELRQESLQVEAVMRRLDRATPDELNRALRQTREELQGIRRGTDAWRQHTDRVRRLQGALNDCNEEMRVQESRLSRLNRWFNDAQTSIMAVTAALAGLVQAARGAVDAFLEMDQEMANVRKYTGMSAEEVAGLNEEFKRIDTRSGREELNKLAQEAGRLGKTSEGDVLGFVRAADKINVALDDLGDGATLTLSKLTGIFGDEARLGTERALLSVGSVINELSQNCSASAPYLARFASRMGGVAAQAGMTIQQVMALGAVLDTTNQGVEAASTAVSQVITRLYQDTGKYARVAGLEVGAFTEKLRRDANGAFLEFLTALNRAGGMDTLSPMFADMGENGARAIAALSSLATHIDEVRAQQEAANRAFAEATSIDQEFRVQNETLLAQKEKALKQFRELSIEVGERLQPLMRYVISSSSVLLRVIGVLFDFVADHVGVFRVVASALGAYYVAVGVAAVRTRLLSAAMGAGSVAAGAWRVAVLAGAAAVNLCTGNVGRAAAAWRALSAVMRANPFGLVAAAVTALSVAVYNLSHRAESLESFVRGLSDASREWSVETVREQRELEVLLGRMRGLQEGSEEYAKAKESLISQYGRYLEGLIDEEGRIVDLEAAYDRLTKAIQRNGRAKGIQAVEDRLNSEYAETVAKNLGLLQEQLEFFGASAGEASEIVTRVAGSVYSGEALDEGVVARINELSAVRAGGQGWFGRSMSWLNNSALMGWVQKGAEALGYGGRVTDVSPAEALNRILSARSLTDEGLRRVESMRDGLDPLRHVDSSVLRLAVESIRSAIEEAGEKFKGEDGFEFSRNVTVLTVDGSNVGELREMTVASARKVLAGYEEALGLRGASKVGGMEGSDGDGFEAFGSGYVSQKNADKEAARAEREAARAARAAAVKAKAEFREGLAAIRAELELSDAVITESYARGEVTYLDYLRGRQENERRFFDDSRSFYEEHFSLLGRAYLDDDRDYQKLLSDKAEAMAKYGRKIVGYEESAIKRVADARVEELRREAKLLEDRSVVDEEELSQRVLEVQVEAFESRMALYVKGSEEWEKLRLELDSVVEKDRVEREVRFQEAVRDVRRRYCELSGSERYAVEARTLDAVFELRRRKLAQLFGAGRVNMEEYAREYRALEDELAGYSEKLRRKYAADLPGSGYARTSEELRRERERARERDRSKVDDAVKSGIISEDEGERRKRQVDVEALDKVRERLRESKSDWVGLISEIGFAWQDLWTSIDQGTSDVLDNIGRAAGATFAAVTAAMELASKFAEARSRIEIKAVEKRYEREAELAQGNTYLTKKLEEEKEERVAEIKNRASKASFRMQVISATAQMIQGAINAYTSTAAIPIVGPALAPAAAAVALAAGAANLALLSKQQEAAEATGYSEGGYTCDVGRDVVAGVVHGGEWVAPADLLCDPVAGAVVGVLEESRKSGRPLAAGDVASAAFGSVVPAVSGLSDVVRSVVPVAVAPVLPSVLPFAASGSAGVSGSGDSAGSASVGSGSVDVDVYGDDAAGLRDVIARLADRLEEPFVAVSSVTGPDGSLAAENRYRRLVANRRRWSGR